MKLIDKDGKLFGKINLVDFGILLLLVLAVVAAGYKIAGPETKKGEEVTIQYTLCIEGVRQQSIDAINKNHENVYDEKKEKLLGKVVATEQKPFIRPVQTDDGEYKMAEYPEKYDYYITIETKGRMTDEGCITDAGKKLLYGDSIGINNGYAKTTGIIEKIDIKN